MAISSRMSAPNNWTAQFYHPNFPTPMPGPGQATAEATDSTIIATAVTPAPATPSTSVSHLTPEGGVSKPSRRRSRASRRTPTTIMNTDTTNFRALVQQFTGGTLAAPFAPTPARGVLNFGGNVNLNGAMMGPPMEAFHHAPPPHMFQQNMSGVDSRLRVVNHLRGITMEGSQAHPGLGLPPSSSSDDVNNSNSSTYNMF